MKINEVSKEYGCQTAIVRHLDPRKLNLKDALDVCLFFVMGEKCSHLTLCYFFWTNKR